MNFLLPQSHYVLFDKVRIRERKEHVIHLHRVRCLWICDIYKVYVLVVVQMVFSALAFAQSEVLWYFQHVGIASSKSKTARVVPVETVRIFSFN